jgi:hypothetical protein
MKILPARAEFFHAVGRAAERAGGRWRGVGVGAGGGGRVDRQTKLIVPFSNFVNAPKSDQ